MALRSVPAPTAAARLRPPPPQRLRSAPRPACRSRRALSRCSLAGSGVDSGAAPSPKPLTSVRFSFLWLSRADYFSDGSVVYHDSPVRALGRPGRRVSARFARPRGAEPWPCASPTSSQLDKLLVSSLTRLLANGLGTPLPRGPAAYDEFVRVARDIAAKRPEPESQHAFVLAALRAILPPPLPALMRAIIAGLRMLGVPVGAAMAWGTAPFAGWLVGPSRVAPRPGSAGAAAEHAAAVATAVAAGLPPPAAPVAVPNGSGAVVVTRCRYLEQSGCRSECAHVCKMPTQAFFAQTLGLPLTMRPNFEDKSCELVFGAPPPPPEEDEALRGPCLAGCARAGERNAGETRACAAECFINLGVPDATSSARR